MGCWVATNTSSSAGQQSSVEGLPTRFRDGAARFAVQERVIGELILAMKALIRESGWLIGSECLRQLSAEGWEVIGIDNDMRS